MSRAEAAAVAAKWQHKSDEVVAFAAPEVPHWPTTSGCRP
jgi:hypothetical protein